MNEQKAIQVKKLIQQTNLLTLQEKADWLNLLELMNDKQLTELQNILMSKNTEAKPVVNNSNQHAGIASPKLSHISEMPAQVSIPKTFTTQPPRNVPVKTNSEMPISTKTVAVQTGRAESMVKPQNIRPQQSVNPVASESATSAVQPVNLQSQEPVKIVEEPMKAATPLQLTFDTLPMLSIEIMRSMGASNLQKILVDMAKTHGYHSVLMAIEQSPLFKDYIAYGKHVLSLNPQSKELPLSQEEFTWFVDMLMAIQVNQS